MTWLIPCPWPRRLGAARFFDPSAGNQVEILADAELPGKNPLATPPGPNISTKKSFALIALAVFIVAEIASTAKFILARGLPYYQVAILSSIEALIFWWFLPVLLVYGVERRDWRSLGLTIRREKRLAYLLGAVIALVLPAFLVGFDRALFIEFAEQVIYIGFAEELFYRGYILQRMCDWMGNLRGLLITSLLFGLGHILSRLAQQDLPEVEPASWLGFQTFLGGLLLGSIYLRARNIWPSAVSLTPHTSVTIISHVSSPYPSR